MKNFALKIIAVCGLVGIAFTAMADRGGISKKSSKGNAMLNIATHNNIRNAIFLNANKGLKYAGNIILKKEISLNSITTNNLISYQKGNTIYVLPNKQIITMPEIKTNYAGLKIVIRKK